MTTLAEFMKARIDEDMQYCIQMMRMEPLLGLPTSPERVLEGLRVQYRIVRAFESCADHPRVATDTALHTQMSTLRNIVGDFARAYDKHPDYMTW